MKFNILFPTAMAVVFMSGCSNVPWITPPATNYDVVKTRSYEKPFDEVWSNILSFSAQNGMLLKKCWQEQRSHKCRANRIWGRYCRLWKRCSMNVTERRGTVNIFVSREKNAVAVTINSDLKESRTMMTAATTTTCSSKGVLEARILEVAGE